MIKENIGFIREALSEFESTGSLFPTSRWAAKLLTRPLHHRGSSIRRSGTDSKRILELGPGNGAVTVHILEHMIDGDELVICEINPRLMQILKRRLRSHPIFKIRRRQVKFFCGPAQELPLEFGKYDVIVCALPFLNFDLKTVKDIFNKIFAVSKKSAEMTYYQYIGLKPLNKVFAPTERKKRIREIEGFFEWLGAAHRIERNEVWLNMLPVHVYNIQMAA